jgi:hypothetical protein
VGLGTYAALLRDAALLLSNDTGPGHLAAAVGAPVISVMGPSDPCLWHPWGPDVQVLGGHGAWPLRPQVRQAVEQSRRAGGRVEQALSESPPGDPGSRRGKGNPRAPLKMTHGSLQMSQIINELQRVYFIIFCLRASTCFSCLIALLSRSLR